MTTETDIEDKILQHEDVRESPFFDFVAYNMRRFAGGVPPFPDRTSAKTLTARIDNGRWLIDCPNCNSALMASRVFSIFICAECGSPENGGLWYTVRYPEERKEIERLLLLRPATTKGGFTKAGIPLGGFRFYAETEQTVDELRAENKELGFDV